MADLTISQDAIDLIVSFEVSDRATYDAEDARPTWPGGASGLTIGIGYDVGYVTYDELHNDWGGHIPDAMINALEDAVGRTGSPAHSLAYELRSSVLVPWDAAMAVFSSRDIPKWIKRVSSVLPNTDKLTPDCLGALVSLAYNRGASFTLAGDRYREMRAIRYDMSEMKLAAIPAQIRSMKRLWPDVKGLIRRREAEAALFEKGLS